MKVTQIHYTKLILDAVKLESYESDVKEFELEIYEGTSSSPSDILLTTKIIPAKQKNDFMFQGVGEIVIDNVTVGNWYWLRTRIVKTNGRKSTWSSFSSEQAGDTINGMSFLTKSVVISSTAVSFRVTVDTVPEDFDRFVWKFSTATASIEDDPNNPPVQPADPLVDAIPDIETNAVDDISVSFNEDRTTWWHVWVRSYDKSGNKSPSTNNNWYYVGCGKIAAINSQSDTDPYPPDNTSHADPTTYNGLITGVNFI